MKKILLKIILSEKEINRIRFALESVQKQLESYKHKSEDEFKEEVNNYLESITAIKELKKNF